MLICGQTLRPELKLELSVNSKSGIELTAYLVADVARQSRLEIDRNWSAVILLILICVCLSLIIRHYLISVNHLMEKDGSSDLRQLIGWI